MSSILTSSPISRVSVTQKSPCSTHSICYWCSGRNKSCTTFTGEKVVIGTSTSTVFQFAIAPFHNPGNSCARRSRPPLDFDEINPVSGSVYSVRLNLRPRESFTPQTKSTGLKWVADCIKCISSGAIWLDSAICNDSVAFALLTQNGHHPARPDYELLHTRG